MSEQTQKILTFGERKITLIGTAHVSSESVNEVSETIKSINPDCVAVELDQKRCDSVQNTKSWSELDIIKVLKSGQGFLLLTNLILASYQKRIGQNVGVKPGDELLAAIKTASELNIPVELVDRPIQITLKRAWAKNSFIGKMKLLAALLSSAFSKEEISSEQIEELKNNSEMDSMMKELSDYMPQIQKVLIDERDRYLASRIWESAGNNIVAVLGAGHLNGVRNYLEQIAEGKLSTDTSEIASVPPKKLSSKILSWVIPILIILLIAFGFYLGGKEKGSQMALSWVLWNGICAAIGSLIGGGHIITILVSFVAAPITSLCPFIGVGIVAGIVQALIVRPKVADMENLSEDVSKLKTFYKNRILRVLLIFLLSSIGSSAGTFISGADIIAKFIEIIQKVLDNL